MKTKPKRRATGAKRQARSLAYPVEFRLRMVKLFLEEEYRTGMLCEQFGVSAHSIQRWVKAYRLNGAEGLEPKRQLGGRPRVAEEVRQQAVVVKTDHPEYGPRRIADVLKRFFLMPTSASTVHKVLAERGLVEKARRKPLKNVAKPRFFERARPNQLWQSDIMPFRLGGHNAYLIGFIDDYSRYITSLGLYRSQTAEHVLESYRRAVAEYGVPREILTDNGRQYTNWRGKTRFEQEMKKDRVRHIRSRPHHPMTLGKIERFWKSILSEFLQRAQFDSFEQAIERTALWVKYYNHKRPHQGIGGLCPADRFFEIAHDLRKTLEKGIEENALELALRGRRVDPFYMVGRMGGQSVVIRAEKGKVRMLLDGADASREKELVYDARKDIDYEYSQTSSQDIRSATENHSGALHLDRTAHNGAALSGDGHQPGAVGSVAESGHRGNAQCIGSEEERPAASTQPPAEPIDRKEVVRLQLKFAETAPGAAEGEKDHRWVSGEPSNGQTAIGAAQRPFEGGDDHEGALRTDQRPAGGRTAGGLAKDLLQVGATRPERDARWDHRAESGTPCQGFGPVSPEPAEAAERSQAADRAVEPQAGAKGYIDRFEAADNRLRPGEKKISESDRHFP
jgi:transposase InsO family protein